MYVHTLNPLYRFNKYGSRGQAIIFATSFAKIDFRAKRRVKSIVSRVMLLCGVSEFGRNVCRVAEARGGGVGTIELELKLDFQTERMRDDCTSLDVTMDVVCFLLWNLGKFFLNC